MKGMQQTRAPALITPALMMLRPSRALFCCCSCPPSRAVRYEPISGILGPQ